MYLNDDFEGGTTNFIHNEYKPNPGTTDIIPSNWIFKHKGSEVISGTKYVAVHGIMCGCDTNFLLLTPLVPQMSYNSNQ